MSFKEGAFFKVFFVLFCGIFPSISCVSTSEDINVADQDNGICGLHDNKCGGIYKSLEVVGTDVDDGKDYDNIDMVNMYYSISDGEFKDIGVPEGVAKDMEVYGEPPDIDEDYLLALESSAAGELHIMTGVQFEEAWNRVIKWKNSHGQWPNYVTIHDHGVGVDKIHKNTYLDMKGRWDNYIKTHNGQKPQKIGIKGPIKKHGMK